MAQQNQKFKFENSMKKRNYNEMISDPVNSSSNIDSVFKNQIFKSALKFGGPINQDLILHQKKNIRKSMNYKNKQANSIFDINADEKMGYENNEEIFSETKEKKETLFDKTYVPENERIKLREEYSTFNAFSKDINRSKSSFDCNIKTVINNSNKDIRFNTEKKITNFLNINYGKKETDGKKDNEINNIIIKKNLVEEKEIGGKPNEEKEEITKIEMNNANNPFIIPNNFNTNNNNESSNPFHSSTNSFFINNNNINKKNNNIVENPFKDISKHKIENQLKNSNPLKANNTNKDNKTITNPFNTNNNNIINPFISSNKNPFSSTSSNNGNIFFNNNKDIQVKNPFLNNNLNPFTSIGNNSITNGNNNTNTNNKILNPFLNNNLISNEKSDNSNNPFLENKSANPFFSSHNNQFTNIFNNNNQQNSTNKNEGNMNEDEENINVEEEIKIEKDENKLKYFKEIKYETNNNNTFCVFKIENMQYLGKVENKPENKVENKYISIGGGMLCIQEENDGGKKIGILILRDIYSKNIKIQAKILDDSCVEKSKLKNGLEFIMIKKILATYFKYDENTLSKETRLTNIRIRIDLNELDNLFKCLKEFFESMKNND